VITKPHQPTPDHHSPPLWSLASLAAVAAVSLLIVLDALTHSAPLVLPAISAALTIGGFAWAVVVALRKRPPGVRLPDQMTGPGLVVFLGCVAAMLSDADRVVSALRMT
jgi:hypothetical protein